MRDISRRSFYWLVCGVLLGHSMSARGVEYRWKLTGLTAESGSQVQGVAVDPKDTQILYAIQAGRFMSSRNGGKTWIQGPNIGYLHGSNSTMGHVRSVVVDPANPSVLYAGLQGGILKSTDAGSTWKDRSTGLPTGFAGMTADVNVLACDPSRPGRIYAATKAGLCVSDDGAEHWTPLSGISGDVIAVAVDPNESATLYVSTLGPDHGLFKSNDSGASWKKVTAEVAGSSLAVATDPRGVVYSAGWNGLFKTIDGMKSWKRIDPPMTFKSCSLVAVAPGKNGAVYTACQKGVFLSNDGGATWRAINDGLYVPNTFRALVVDSTSPGRVFLAAEGQTMGLLELERQ